MSPSHLWMRGTRGYLELPCPVSAEPTGEGARLACVSRESPNDVGARPAPVRWPNAHALSHPIPGQRLKEEEEEEEEFLATSRR